MAGAGVSISARSDGSQAVIELLHPQNLNGYPISMDDVVAALSLHNVVNGLLTFEIEEALRRTLESGQPVAGIVAARVRTEKELFFFGASEAIPSRVFSEKVSAAREVYRVAAGQRETLEGCAEFVEAGTLLFQVNMQDAEDIFGRPIRDNPLPVNVHKGDNVSEHSSEGCIQYTAEKSGYLVVDDAMRLCVFEPFITSADRLSQTFLALPTRRQMLRPLLALYQTRHEQKQELGLILTDLQQDLQTIMELQERGEARRMRYCMGISPVRGEPGHIHFFIDLFKKPVAGADGKIDMHEFSPFCVVHEGDTIAEYHFAKPGEPGKGVDGEEILPSLGEDLEIAYGGNLIVTAEEGKEVIRAATSGILKYSDKFIEVSESLVISGDFGPATGNLCFEKNIIITGDVKGGYQLESGGDITIRGSIEAGARVFCGGNLTVFKGLFGHESQIIVKGKADIGYIQEGRLQAGGDVNVYKYVSDSWVKCRGNLRVVGQGVKGLERGAVMGGEVYCLGCAVLHSVGTIITPTKLGCGFDPDLYRQLKQCRAAITALETRVLELQRTAGVGLRSTQLAAIIKRMAPEQKLALAQKLSDIKELLTKRQTLEQKRVELERMTFAPNLEMVAITVERHLVPKVIFVVGEAVHIETNYISNFSIRKGRHGVYIHSLAKSAKDEKLV